MDDRRSISPSQIAFRIRALLLKIVSFMNLLDYFLIFVLNLLNFLLQIFKLLMQMGNLLRTPRCTMLVDTGRWSDPSCLADLGTPVTFSKSLAHF